MITHNEVAAGLPTTVIEGKPPEPCSADDPFYPGGCPDPAAGYVRVACVHEHIREGFLCVSHLERMEAAYCRICRDLGHDCKLEGYDNAGS